MPRRPRDPPWANPKPAVHDHYDGSAHCVECAGPCTLTGPDRHYTELVRFLFETMEQRPANPFLNVMLRSALERAGVDVEHHQRRAKATR